MRRLTTTELDERLGPLPVFSVTPLIEAVRLHGETLIAAATRVLAREAMARTDGKQGEAGELIGLSPRTMNYLLAQYEARPLDLERKRKEHAA